MQRKPIILSAVHGLQLLGVQPRSACTGESAPCPLRSAADTLGEVGMVRASRAAVELLLFLNVPPTPARSEGLMQVRPRLNLMRQCGKFPPQHWLWAARKL